MFVPQKKDGEPVPLSDKIIFNHLCGKYAIAVYAGSETSKFITVDVDVDDPTVVKKVIDAIEEIGIPRTYVHVSFSGRKGYHIDVLFDRLVKTAQLRKLYEHILFMTGIGRRIVEFRPSSAQAVKLPLAIHMTTDKRGWYVDRDTLEHIESMDYVFDICPFPAYRLVELIQDLPDYEVKGEAERHPAEPNRFEYGDELTEAGSRHDIMVRMAVACQYAGDSEEVCRSELEAWYRNQDQELIKSSAAEVMRDIDGILAWAYSERFERRGAGLVRITTADAQMILDQQRKSERKILFLLMVYCATGRSMIKQTSIAYITGYTRMTVIRAMHSLEERGVIRRSADKTVFKDGFFKAAKTRYEVIRPKATRGMMRVNVYRKQLKEDFDRVFCDTIEQLKNGEVKASGDD